MQLRHATQCKLLYFSPSFIREKIYNPAWIYDQQCLTTFKQVNYSEIYLNG